MKKRILIVAPNLRVSNGVTSFLMNNYPYVVEAGFEIDFLLCAKIDSKYNSYVEENGSKIFIYPESNKYSFKNKSYASDVIKQNKYDIIHINTSGMWAYWALAAAKQYGVNTRIYHSHNPKESTSLKGYAREIIFDFLCFGKCNAFMACTEHAGNSVFGKRKYHVIPNGIFYDRFKFNSAKRSELRQQLGIEESLVIGTVCRQADQKNPFFMIDILSEMLKIDNTCALIWVGTGPLLNDVKNYAQKNCVADHVHFLGDRNDVNDIYNAMDLFLLPSKYEGLGIVYMEAQANGLQCFASVNVPKDTDLTGSICYISLKEDAQYWAEYILNTMRNKELNDRCCAVEKAYHSSTYVLNSSKVLIDCYNYLEKGVK